MKKIILGMLVLGAITSTSCKKDKDDPSCEKTVAGIANTYKLTNATVQSSAGGGEIDAGLSACNKSGIYVLKSDKTCTYNEPGSSCGVSESGTWDVVNGVLSIDAGALAAIGDLDIDTWDCTNLTLSDKLTASGITATTRFYLVKQ